MECLQAVELNLDKNSPRFKEIDSLKRERNSYEKTH
jgi:hypothetical protein